MSIVSSANITAYLGVSTYTADLQAIHEGIEQLVKNICQKTFESASYFELYDGVGAYTRLHLNYTPVTAVARVSTDLDAVIKIKNTLTDSSTASVVVDSANVTLTVAGGTGNATNTLAIATYTTLTLLVGAINALSASGWVAELYNSSYSAKKTSLLIPQQQDLTSWVSAEDYDYLYMGEPISFKFVSRYNAIEASFPYGSQNIAVSYTAGSTPADIGLAVRQMVKYAYDQKTGDSENVKRLTVGDITTEYFTQVLEQMPMVASILAQNTNIYI